MIDEEDEEGGDSKRQRTEPSASGAPQQVNAILRPVCSSTPTTLAAALGVPTCLLPLARTFVCASRVLATFVPFTLLLRAEATAHRLLLANAARDPCGHGEAASREEEDCYGQDHAAACSVLQGRCAKPHLCHVKHHYSRAPRFSRRIHRGASLLRGTPLNTIQCHHRNCTQALKMPPQQWEQAKRTLLNQPVTEQLAYLKKIIAHYKEHHERQKQQRAKSELEQAAAEAAKKVQVRLLCRARKWRRWAVTHLGAPHWRPSFSLCLGLGTCAGTPRLCPCDVLPPYGAVRSSSSSGSCSSSSWCGSSSRSSWRSGGSSRRTASSMWAARGRTRRSSRSRRPRRRPPTPNSPSSRATCP